MKKRFIIILSLLLPVVALTVWGFVSFKREIPNGFNRNFRNDMLVLTGEVNSTEALISVNTITKYTTYFTPQTPQKIALLKTGEKDLRYEMLPVPYDQWINYNYSMQVDSPFTMLFAGNLPAVFTKESGVTEGTIKLDMKSKHFNAALQYQHNRYFIRVYSAAERDYIVAKANGSGQVEGYENKASYLTHDNGMSSQAHMVYSPEHHKLLLVQKMSNQIRCLDTNLNLLYAAKTIDTFSLANIKEVIKEEKNSKVGTQSAPPRYTNYAVAISGNQLYCYSKLTADNQPDRLATIDVYSIGNGNYEYSFTLPQTEKQNLVDFKIFENRLVALVGNGKKILTYEIKEQSLATIKNL